jgi:cysteine dioxygenase
MTTSITPTAQTSFTPIKHRHSPLSLGALMETLSTLSQVPPLEQLNEWLEQVQVERAELRPHIGFKMGTYARHRVFRNEFVEMLVLCWRPGQLTPIHDHNGSWGAVRVFEGVMWETTFVLEETRGLAYQAAREWTKGQLTGATVSDIHQLGNPEVSGQDLITLHLYAPPLGSINTYRIGLKEPLTTLWMNSWNPTI